MMILTTKRKINNRNKIIKYLIITTNIILIAEIMIQTHK